MAFKEQFGLKMEGVASSFKKIVIFIYQLRWMPGYFLSFDTVKRLKPLVWASVISVYTTKDIEQEKQMNKTEVGLSDLFRFQH